jgi:AcrR family transcriptional regulator
MRYSPGRREETRSRIIRTARKLFNRFGFDLVSIDRIMAEAGLTRGGFYKYFETKGDLYVEALGCFFTEPGWNNNWNGVDLDLSVAEVGPQIVAAYLSQQHFEDVENSCPMIALPSDVARSSDVVKRAYETVFKAMVAVLHRYLRTEPDSDRDTAVAIAALCVGGMVIARAMDDRALADTVRAASLEIAMRLGGWSKAKPASANSRKVQKGMQSRRSR